jgi:hypothetical protein
MMVEHLAAETVRDLGDRVARARRTASEQLPEQRDRADDPSYWQQVFEANAAALLANLSRVQLTPGYAVRYRFYGRRGNDFSVRPFVARADTDVSSIMRVLDWHQPPDAGRGGESGSGRDVELLYRHFTVEPSAAGVFEYWLAMQELWASHRWIHSTVIVDAEHFAQLTADPQWTVERPVERVEPAVIRDADGSQIAVLVHCPIDRHVVTFHSIRITAEQAVVYAESILVAHGPRGYVT